MATIALKNDTISYLGQDESPKDIAIAYDNVIRKTSRAIKGDNYADIIEPMQIMVKAYKDLWEVVDQDVIDNLPVNRGVLVNKYVGPGKTRSAEVFKRNLVIIQNRYARYLKTSSIEEAFKAADDLRIILDEMTDPSFLQEGTKEPKRSHLYQNTLDDMYKMIPMLEKRAAKIEDLIPIENIKLDISRYTGTGRLPGSGYVPGIINGPGYVPGATNGVTKTTEADVDIWPWLIGAGVLGGGVLLVLRKRKRKK